MIWQTNILAMLFSQGIWYVCQYKEIALYLKVHSGRVSVMLIIISFKMVMGTPIVLINRKVLGLTVQILDFSIHMGFFFVSYSLSVSQVDQTGNMTR